MFLLRLFRVRAIQFYRVSLEIGLLRSLVVLILLFFLFLMVHYFTATFWRSIILIAGSSLLIYSLHSRRKDKVFLSKFSIPLSLILFTEYNILLSPVIFFIIFSSYYWLAFVLIAVVFLISCSSFKISPIRVNLYFLRLIPSYNFEWISGMRKNYKAILLFYVLALLLAGISYVSLFIIWILNLIMVEFYSDSEPLQILLTQGKNTQQFLRWKFKTQSACYIVFILPLYILYSLWNYENGYIILIFFLLNFFCFTFLIWIKYSSYTPDKKYQNGIITLLVFISSFILPLLPLSIFLYIRSARSAVRNLNFYLHDFN